MSGLLSLLRASLLGACLCIAAAQLPHVQSARFSAAQPDLAEHADTRSIQLARRSLLAPPEAPAQWIASASGTGSSVPVQPSHPQTPFDSQPLGDLGDTEPDAHDGDDGDDFDEAMSHAHLGLFCLDFGVAPHRRPVHRAREHLRLEDRRCDKPPRARHV